jgi:hypothetical protein
VLVWMVNPGHCLVSCFHFSFCCFFSKFKYSQWVLPNFSNISRNPTSIAVSWLLRWRLSVRCLLLAWRWQSWRWWWVWVRRLVSSCSRWGSLSSLTSLFRHAAWFRLGRRSRNLIPSFVGLSCRDFFSWFKQASNERLPIFLVVADFDFLYPVYHGSLTRQ